MRKNISKPLIWLSVMLVILFVCMIFSDLIQRDFNNVEVTEFYGDAGNGEILTYKLYKPVSATKDNKAPAVLLMHGYQNDKETNAAYSIELARRGIVALSIDEYGHGSTSIGLRERG